MPHDTQNEIAESRIRLERYLGEQIPKQVTTGRPKKGGHDVTLSDIGVHPKQSSRWQEAATLPEEDFEEHISEVKEKGQKFARRVYITMRGCCEPLRQASRKSGRCPPTPAVLIRILLYPQSEPP